MIRRPPISSLFPYPTLFLSVPLLPRHWEWLNRQPGGASGALRRLIEEARGKHAAQDAVRAATEAVYRFMSEMAGDLPHFEDASRALFARQAEEIGRAHV